MRSEAQPSWGATVLSGSTGFPDARTLLIIVFVVTSLAIVFSNPVSLGILLVLSLSALLTAKIPLAQLGKRIWRYRWLFLLLVLAQSLTNNAGRVFLVWRGHVLLSQGGLTAALAALLRIAVILAVVLLLSLKDYQQVVTGLAQLGTPYELAFMVLLAIRFLPVLAEEFRQSTVAIALRGVDFKAVPLREKIRIYSYVLMPTTAAALIRSRRIAIAMEARAFRAYSRRTWLEWPALTPGDWVIIVLVVLGAGVAIWMKTKGVLA